MAKISKERAYDRLRWDFIEWTLTQTGYAPQFTELIMGCVTSVVNNITFNSTYWEAIRPRNRIRQRIPYPYIFLSFTRTSLCKWFMLHKENRKYNGSIPRPLFCHPHHLWLLEISDLSIPMKLDYHCSREKEKKYKREKKIKKACSL